jgi:maltooligosyltrehalose trehalohydrolase
MLAWHRSLIALRRSEPALRDPRLEEVSVVADPDERWLVVRRPGLLVVANLAAEPRAISIGTPVVDVVLTSAEGTVEWAGDSVTLQAESVAVIRVAG